MELKKPGTEFEDLTAEVNGQILSGKDVTIERNVQLRGPDGPREFDLLLTQKLDDLDIRTAVECKDYRARVDIQRLDAFVAKCSDLNIEKKVMVSRKGFSSGAKAKAKRSGVALYTLDQADAICAETDKKIPIKFWELDPQKLELRAKIRGGAGGFIEKIESFLLNGLDLVLQNSARREILEAGIERVPEAKELEIEIHWGDFPPELVPPEFRIDGVVFTVYYTVRIRCGWTDHLPREAIRTNVETGAINFFLLQPDGERIVRDLFVSEAAIPESIAMECWKGVGITGVSANGLRTMIKNLCGARK